MALVQLHEKGLLKYIVSQNCDGLHRKSGINAVSCHGHLYHTQGHSLTEYRIAYPTFTATVIVNVVATAAKSIFVVSGNFKSASVEA